MKTKNLLFICLVLLSKEAFNQTNVFPNNGSAGIGTTTPNASSLMEMVSTTKGVLIPRMTQTQRDAIVSPATGLLIYQTTNTPGFYYYNGSAWTPISTKGANMSLSNLKSPTAVNMNLQPAANGTIDLGSNSFGWKDLYSTGAFYINGSRAFATPDTTNTFVGKNAGISNAPGGYYNTAVGSKALYSNTTGAINTAIGYRALYQNTTGGANTATGYQALASNTEGDGNVASGYYSLAANIVGLNNTATGNATLSSNGTGSYNAAFGAGAGAGNHTGNSNVAVGALALYFNQAGSNLVAVGDSALFYQNGGAGYNTAIGSKSLFSNTTGESNTAVGSQALYLNSTGSNNTALGSAALAVNTTGNKNTAIGVDALWDNSTGSGNIAIGHHTMMFNETGNDNVAIGRETMGANYTGYSNIAIGPAAFASSAGSSNTIAIGDSALFSQNTATAANVAVGSKALWKNTSGTENTAVGKGSLNYNTTGGYNTALGSISLTSCYGSGNTGVGYYALGSITSGTFNTSIGYDADASAGNLTNSIAIGYGTIVNASNKAVIGNNSVGVIGGHVGWSILSDGRFKNNIKENVPGLEFINKLRPVTYNIDETKFAKFIGLKDSVINTQKDAYAKASQKIRTGFVAQEVEKTAKDINYDFDGVNHPQNDKDNYSLVYSDFIPSVVKAVQQLSKQNEEQQKEIDQLKTVLNAKNGTTVAATNPSAASATQIVDLGASLKLEQNSPNPFNASTVIKYYLPVNDGNVSMNFYNNSGALLKSIKLNGTGNGVMTVNAHDLPSGAYRYALLSDGRVIDSKQMIAGK